MGAVKQAMLEQQEFNDFALTRALSALRRILELDPSDTNEGHNEWGEAECFHQARRIARLTLKAIREGQDNGHE